MKKKILFIMFLLVMIIPFNVKAVKGGGGGSNNNSGSSTGITIPNKDANSKFSCTNYVYDQCPKVDSYGNVCKVLDSNGVKQCVKNGDAKTCEEYCNSGVFKAKDDYGSTCHRVTSTSSKCYSDTSTKYKFKAPKVCENMNKGSCVGHDYKGYVCNWLNNECKTSTAKITKTTSYFTSSGETEDVVYYEENNSTTSTPTLEEYGGDIESLEEKCNKLGDNCSQNPYCTYKNGECTVKTSILKKYQVEEYQPGDKFFSEDETVKTCGFELPARLPHFTSQIYDIVKVMVPVVIIILGMFDFLKVVMANKEENAKKEKDKFIRRLIAGVIVFFVMVAVEFVFNHIDVDEKNGMISCMKCILSNNNCNGKNSSPTQFCTSYQENNCPSTTKYNGGSLPCTPSDGKCVVDCQRLGASSCNTYNDVCKLENMTCDFK